MRNFFAISVLKVRYITSFSVIINIVSFCGFEYPIEEDLPDKISELKHYFQAKLIWWDGRFKLSVIFVENVDNLKTNRNGRIRCTFA